MDEPQDTTQRDEIVRRLRELTPEQLANLFKLDQDHRDEAVFEPGRLTTGPAPVFTIEQAEAALADYNARPSGQPAALDARKLVCILEELAQCGTIGISCQLHGLQPKRLGKIRKEHPGVEDLLTEALNLYQERLRLAVHRRAVEGWLEPVFFQGICVGHIRKWSDKMLELQAKRHLPEYRDRHSVDVTVTNGVLVIPSPTPDPKGWLENAQKQPRMIEGKVVGDDPED